MDTPLVVSRIKEKRSSEDVKFDVEYEKEEEARRVREAESEYVEGFFLLSYLIAIRFPKFPFRNNNEEIERNNNEKCDSTGKFTRAMRAT